ncbi:hypothetical protein MDA_GLEAN10020950 [Myotis davidii]|uniref:Uncharacterized protein n=1 Tax=Myotis davidii TaxID=225400 RepID=L5M664_MYODS|nr:hypothetical protein MDA_GLEAN10020950 [Myotis davidii]
MQQRTKRQTVKEEPKPGQAPHRLASAAMELGEAPAAAAVLTRPNPKLAGLLCQPRFPTRYRRQVFQGNRSNRRQGSRVRPADSNAAPTSNNPAEVPATPERFRNKEPSQRTRAARHQQQLTRCCTRGAPNSRPFPDHLLFGLAHLSSLSSPQSCEVTHYYYSHGQSWTIGPKAPGLIGWRHEDWKTPPYTPQRSKISAP